MGEFTAEEDLEWFFSGDAECAAGLRASSFEAHMNGNGWHETPDPFPEHRARDRARMRRIGAALERCSATTVSRLRARFGARRRGEYVDSFPDLTRYLVTRPAIVEAAARRECTPLKCVIDMQRTDREALRELAGRCRAEVDEAVKEYKRVARALAAQARALRDALVGEPGWNARRFV